MMLKLKLFVNRRIVLGVVIKLIKRFKHTLTVFGCLVVMVAVTWAWLWLGYNTYYRSLTKNAIEKKYPGCYNKINGDLLYSSVMSLTDKIEELKDTETDLLTFKKKSDDLKNKFSRELKEFCKKEK